MTRPLRPAVAAVAPPTGALDLFPAIGRLLSLGGSLVQRLPVLICAGTGWCCAPAITAPSVETITLEPSVLVLGVGQTETVVATAKDQAGAQVFAVAFTWSSSDTAVALVDEAGQVAAQGEGTATIRAAAGGRVGSATVTAVQRPVGAHTISRPPHPVPEP